MLTEIRVQNRGPVKDLTVRLSPVTVFVGDNGTGKTTVLEEIRASILTGVLVSVAIADCPECGLHPRKQVELSEQIQETAKQGKQIVYATHSPFMLDHCTPDQVRLFTLNDAGKTEVHELRDLPDVEARLKGCYIGELVYNEGEESLVKEIKEGKVVMFSE